MSPRVYTRKFDWDEAARMHASGMSKAAIARQLGVSTTAVAIALDPEMRERYARRAHEWTRDGRCPDCGGKATRHGPKQLHCRRCASLRRITTVREDTLRCTTCKTWKPDEDFPSDRSQPHRRNRSRQCRPCQTIAKRRWRERYPERSADLDRRTSDRLKAERAARNASEQA